MSDNIKKILEEVKPNMPEDIKNLVSSFFNINERIIMCDICGDADICNEHNFIDHCKLKNSLIFCTNCAAKDTSMLCVQCYCFCDKCNNRMPKNIVLVRDLNSYQCYSCFGLFCEFCFDMHDTDECNEKIKLP